MLQRVLDGPAYIYVGALLSVVLLLLALASVPPQMANTILIETATVARLAPTPYPVKKVTLPHVWDDEQPPWHGDAHYLLDWPSSLGRDQVSAQGTRLGLYVPRVGARFRVWLNDSLLADEGWASDNYVDTSVVPHLIFLPTALIQPEAQQNRLVIELRGQLLRKSGLGVVTLGSYQTLQARYQQVVWWQVYATWMVAACSALMGLLALLMWLQNRERMFALLAVVSFAWSLRLGLTPLVQPPMPFEVWFFFHKFSFTLYCGFGLLFLWELFGQPQSSRVIKVLKWLLWLSPLWLAATTLTQSYIMYRLWTAVIVSGWLVALGIMATRARSGLNDIQRLTLVVGAVEIFTGIRDFLVVQLGWAGDADLRWMTPGSLVLMLTLTWALVQRSARYVEQIGHHNRELVAKVAQKETELKQAFNLLRQAERQQVLADERSRLTRDIHDGLGSQLVQTLNVVRAGSLNDSATVSTMLSQALEELRITLDALEPMDGDLATILGTLRRRIAPALTAANVELDWQVCEVPALAQLNSRAVMHLFRCLQEVFANIVKHAGASRVRVRTWDDNGQVLLSVSDNGQGLGTGTREGGLGMANLRMRAAELGASLSFSDAQPGTCVTLAFAIKKPASQP